MITAVDTNVLLDVFGADPSYGERSAAALRESLALGTLIACEVVWAELRSVFARESELVHAMSRLGVQFGPLDQGSALAAGRAFSEYRARGGRRERVVPDFLIGAHARWQCDRLLTRDRGFYRSYFDGLDVIDPAHSPAHRP